MKTFDNLIFKLEFLNYTNNHYRTHKDNEFGVSRGIDFQG